MTRLGSDRPVGESPEPAWEDDEQGLLERARDGDPRAFSALVRQNQHVLYGLVVRMVKDSAIAEELTQDVFIKAFRSLHSFRGEARWSTWLYRIAVNICHDYYASAAARRRRDEWSMHAPEAAAWDPPSPVEGPEDLLLTRELVSDFQKGLDALDPVYRTAFILRHQEGLEYGDMATILEISPGNAKVRVHRAREMILERMRERGHRV